MDILFTYLNMDVIDICKSFYLVNLLIKLVLSLKILKFQLECAILAPTFPLSIPYIFACPIAMQYGEDAAKTGQNRITFCRFYTLRVSSSLAS
jgi:hypothetical protein